MSDAFFSNVSSLLHLDGTNGSTTFTDVKGKTWTGAGLATISTTQSKFGGGSAVFTNVAANANGRISTPHHSDFNLAASDFTLEAWVYNTATAGNQSIMGKDGVFNSSYPSWSLLINGSRKLALQVGSGNGTSSLQSMASTASVALNTWTHVAAVRSGSTVRLFIDGVLDSTHTITATITDGGKEVYIGDYTGNTATNDGKFRGYIDDVRITKGIARYSASFTAPTAAFPDVGVSLPSGGDPYFASVTALLHFEGANGATTTTDSSGAPKAVTFYGNAQISTAQSKFGGSSLYLDGAGDYLRVDTALDDLLAVTDKWTIEAWVYRTAAGSAPYIFGINRASDGANVVIIGADAITLLLPTLTELPLPPLALNEWVHVAATYDGQLLRVFRGGKAVCVVALTPATALASCVLGIGAEFDAANGGTPGNYFPGYIDDFRVTASVARYTKDFPVPASAFPDILGDGAEDPQFANVSALLHMDGANGSAAFVDVKGGTWTAAGNAQLSTAQSKFGGASGYFDGAGDEVYTTNTAIAAGSVLTMEAWVYITENPPASPGWGCPVFGQGGAAGDGEQLFGVTADRKLRFYKGSGVGGAVIDVSSAAGAVPLNAWTHVAATLDGTTARVFVNGVLSGSVAATASWVNTGQPFRIGRVVVVGYSSFQGYFKGWIDDARVTRNVARYTGDFTPPTAPFPDSAEPTEGGGTVVVPVTRAWGFVS